MAEIKIKITTDTKSASANVKELERGFNGLSKALSPLRQNIALISNSLLALNIGFNAIKGGLNSFISTARSIAGLNSEYEELKIKLTGLIAINHKNVDSLGKTISAGQKWQLSSQKANETIKN